MHITRNVLGYLLAVSTLACVPIEPKSAGDTDAEPDSDTAAAAESAGESDDAESDASPEDMCELACDLAASCSEDVHDCLATCLEDIEEASEPCVQAGVTFFQCLLTLDCEDVFDGTSGDDGPNVDIPADHPCATQLLDYSEACIGDQPDGVPRCDVPPELPPVADDVVCSFQEGCDDDSRFVTCDADDTCTCFIGLDVVGTCSSNGICGDHAEDNASPSEPTTIFDMCCGEPV